MILNNHLLKLIKNPGINFHPGINTLQGADFRKTYSPDWKSHKSCRFGMISVKNRVDFSNKQILPTWNDFGHKSCTCTHKSFTNLTGLE